MATQVLNHNLDPSQTQSLRDVTVGENVKLMKFINLYGCTLGDNVFIGPFVEIQSGVTIGARSRVQSHSFICEGVTIAEEVFIGHGVLFVNDLWPRAANVDSTRKTEKDWKCLPIIVGKRVSIGSGAIIMGGVTIGDGAMIGAGAIITKDVDAKIVIRGEPARITRTLRTSEEH